MNNQKGFTLFEVLVSVVITTIVLLFSTSLLTTAIKSEKNINSDIDLRDEADYIMSNLVKEIYITRESTVEFVEEPTQNNFYLYKITDSSKMTGFKNQQILINGSSITPSKVKVLWDKSEINVTENAVHDRTYNITLTLETIDEWKIQKTFRAEVRSINDKTNDD